MRVSLDGSLGSGSSRRPVVLMVLRMPSHPLATYASCRACQGSIAEMFWGSGLFTWSTGVRSEALGPTEPVTSLMACILHALESSLEIVPDREGATGMRVRYVAL